MAISASAVRAVLTDVGSEERKLLAKAYRDATKPRTFEEKVNDVLRRGYKEELTLWRDQIVRVVHELGECYASIAIKAVGKGSFTSMIKAVDYLASHSNLLEGVRVQTRNERIYLIWEGQDNAPN